MIFTLHSALCFIYENFSTFMFTGAIVIACMKQIRSLNHANNCSIIISTPKLPFSGWARIARSAMSSSLIRLRCFFELNSVKLGNNGQCKGSKLKVGGRLVAGRVLEIYLVGFEALIKKVCYKMALFISTFGSVSDNQGSAETSDATSFENILNWLVFYIFSCFLHVWKGFDRDLIFLI